MTGQCKEVAIAKAILVLAGKIGLVRVLEVYCYYHFVMQNE